jgi:hypothetical protein
MLAASRSRLRFAPLAVIALAGPLLPAARAAVTLPGNVLVKQVDFERHLMGLFGRMGCNAGACHGSFQGKGGFRLSLFGYDPARDYAALTRDNLGRRLNPVDPERSLFLLKATGQVQHGGGRRFARGSWQYRLFREWIVNGARWQKGSGTVTALTVTPEEYASIRPGQQGRVRVRARFGDGSEEDVTALCDFRVQDDAVAEVAAQGALKALRPGDTPLVVSYRGNVRAIRVLVPMPVASTFRYPKVPEVNYIDREVFAKLRRLNMVPSDLSGDAEFLRRVTIDTIGCLPTPDEVRAFLADKAPDKRAKKIDQLLAHPLHAALWATRFCDITGNNTAAIFAAKGGMQAKYSQMWHDWFRKRLAANMPYDEIVRGVLCATSRDGKSTEEWMKEVKEIEEAAVKSFDTPYADRPTLDLFWRIGRQRTLELMGERTASAFMGVRLECAQCHKHPFDRWTQADYRAYANVFTQVAVGLSAETRQILLGSEPPPPPRGKLAKGKKGKPKGFGLPKGSGLLNEVFVGGKMGRGLPDPDAPVVVLGFDKKKRPILQKAPPLPARALGGPVIPIRPDQDPRATLFEWLRAPDNPFFARSFANRVWGHYFGIGLVDPVDSLSQANPPSNARLLDALARDFVQSKFDIRRLERTVLNSRTYQLSSTMNATNKLDRNNYAHSYVRPLMAEVVVDVLNSALGVAENFGPDARPGCRAIEIGASRVLNPNLAYTFRIFGRPERTLSCECERSMEPALPQTLYLMTDPVVMQKLYASLLGGKGKGKGKGLPAVKLGKFQAVFEEGRLARVLQGNRTDAEVLDELFLATLTRYPTEAERQVFAEYRAKRKEVVADPNETPKQKKLRAYNALKERELSFIDALWALINTREFILNH